MKISLTDAGKRFNRDWIFRHFSYQFETGSSYAITGHNGSGKSTLLQVLSGSMMLNEGKVEWGIFSREPGAGSRESGAGSQESLKDDIYSQVSICAPYLELIEEMTLTEFLQFHSGFNLFLPGITSQLIIDKVGLAKAAGKQIRYYSSGMKQRVKLAQCIFSATSIVLLDEPCTNLDADGIALYHSLINDYCKDRLVIVSSNDETEYSFCKEKISMGDYK